MADEKRTVEGRLLAVTGKAAVNDALIWFAGRTVDGHDLRFETRSSTDGSFELPLPDVAMSTAHVGVDLEGVSPVDLEPGGQVLEPGEMVVMVDDIVPGHLRNAI